MNLLLATGASLDGFSPDSNSYQLPRGLARLAGRLELLVPAPGRLPAELRSLAHLRRGGALASVLRRSLEAPPDAVITGVDAWSQLVGTTLRAVRRVPWFMVCWDHPFGRRYVGRTSVARRAERRARLSSLRRAVATCDGLVLLINPGLTASLGLAPRRLIPLTNGVALDEIDAALRAGAGDGRAAPSLPGRRHDQLLGVLGAVSVEKGALLLLDMFALVAARHEAARLRFVGEVAGRDLEQVQARVRALRLAAKVEFTGPVDFARAMRLMSECALGLHAYRAEPWLRWNQVLKLGEYQALGVAVVAADRPGVRDLVVHERTGLIVASEAPEAYAAAASALLADPARRAALTVAARTAAEGRSWPRVHEELFARLERLVGQRRRP